MEELILRLDRQSLPEPHILPTLARVSLEITRGQVRQRTRPVTRRVFLIGAASDGDLVLGDLSFPEAYAYLFVGGAEVTIRRLGSGPTLVVCGEEVETAELFHGDLIEMGPFALRVVIDQPTRRRSRDEESVADSHRQSSEHLIAIDEVRHLLADVQQALSLGTVPLRLYSDPDEQPGRTTGSAWLRASA